MGHVLQAYQAMTPGTENTNVSQDFPRCRRGSRSDRGCGCSCFRRRRSWARAWRPRHAFRPWSWWIWSWWIWSLGPSPLWVVVLCRRKLLQDDLHRLRSAHRQRLRQRLLSAHNNAPNSKASADSWGLSLSLRLCPESESDPPAICGCRLHHRRRCLKVGCAMRAVRAS